MNKKIKTIYLLLSIILLLLIILFFTLDILGLELNMKFFTYNQTECEKKFEELDKEYIRLFGEKPGEYTCTRPSLFKVK